MWLQRFMTVGAAGDEAEHEADRVAGEIAGSSRPAIAPVADVQPQSTGSGRGPAGGALDAGVERAIEGARQHGEAIEPTVRAEFEGRFAADFGSVRIHRDGNADRLSRSLGAHAFTTERDIFFAQGAYAPGTASGRYLLAHELAHTVQQGAVPAAPVRRKVRADTSHDRFISDLDADPVARSKLDWIPSTGLGRFDAEYLPTRGELRINIRVLFDFCQKVEGGLVTPGGWSKKEKNDFFDAFKAQAEAAWSGKYTFSCTKPGWQDLAAKVVIDVSPAKKESKAHFQHRIQKDKKFSTGIGREQGGQTDTTRVINIGNFAEQDAPVRPHDSKTTCDGMASHDQLRLLNLIKAHNVNPVRFVGDGVSLIAPASRAALDEFAKGVNETERPGSVPVPLVVNGKENRRERRKKNDDSAQSRADTVATYLNSKGLKNPAKTGKFTDIVEAQQAVYESKKSKLSKEAEKAKLDPLKARQDHREAELDVDIAFKWTGDPYSILAHEFGHMLGNPDEYFEYGSAKVRDQKAAQLLASGRPEDAIRAVQVQQAKPSGNESHTEAQEAFGELAESAGQKIPEFGPKTSSIMSAGADVLPVHYVPLWEVLGAITADAIKPEEWKIT
jgi:hypothetical protein